jgi:magnesium-transporting ATPase (P-type)
LEDEMIRVLCYAAVVLLILGLIREGLEFGWQESVSILIAVFITIAISTGSYYWKERMIQSLKDLSKSKDVLVYRGGNLITLPTHDLLVGDIVRI